MEVSGWQHISKLCEDKDTPSLQRWLEKVGKSLPVTHLERKEMASNPHKEIPGSGVMYWEDEQMRKSEKSPDYKGFLVLEMDYRAGEKLKVVAWQKPTSRGTNLLALKEDNYFKKKNMEEGKPTEVRPSYTRSRRDDDDVPF